MEKEKNKRKAENSKHNSITFSITYILVHQFINSTLDQSIFLLHQLKHNFVSFHCLQFLQCERQTVCPPLTHFRLDFRRS